MAYVTIKQRDGRIRKMQARYAKILVGMGRADYLTDAPEPAPIEPPAPQAYQPRAVSRPAAELAEQYGIDLADVQGSGAGGMITKPDVERLIEG